jgi:hypothetical protein
MIRVAAVYAFALSLSLVCCSIARGQLLDFKVDGPATVAEGDYVELTVMFPEGVKADVDFTPIEETDFGVHPVVSETLVKGKVTASVVGRKCTFSARCQGERDLIVVATAFASFDGLPRVKSIKHKIRVTARQAPNPPPVPPTPPPTPPVPPGDDDLGPWVPLPGATAVPPPNEDMEKVTKILSNVLDRLEAIEKRATAVTVAAPAPVAVADASKPAPVPVVAKPAPVASAAIVDVRPGHWSVGSDWSPSKSQAIAHLRNEHPSKARQHEPLESLSLDAVLTLHDDAHEGRASATSRAVVSSPVSVYSQPVVRYAQPAGGCPGGVCPTPSRSYVRRGFFFR